MDSRVRLQPKLSQTSTPAPIETQFQPRPFVDPLQPKAPPSEHVDLQAKLDAANRFGFSYTKMVLAGHDNSDRASVQPIQPVLQRKLAIGAPGDQYEQEADSLPETLRERIAAQVVSQIHASNPEPQSVPEQRVQRVDLPEDDELQMKPMVPRSLNGAVDASVDLEGAIAQARGSGQPLADPIRQPMEQAFGADFSNVKVHSDAQSDQLNRSIQAKAFTTGQDIFFRQGAYQPDNQSGQELIAHELTHLMQQNREVAQRSQPQPPGKTIRNDPFAPEHPNLIITQGTLSLQRKFTGSRKYLNAVEDWIGKNHKKLLTAFLNERDNQKGKPKDVINWLEDQGIKEKSIPDFSELEDDDSDVATKKSARDKKVRKRSPSESDEKTKRTTKKARVESNNESDDDEPEQSTSFDPTRGLNLINFSGSGIQVLTETFKYKKEKRLRSRSVEWKVPFSQWGGGAQGQARTTPTPMSLYSPGDTKTTYKPDQNFDPEGKYQKGHMVPASSGAPNHFALTTPMEQYTNQMGAWKKTEEAVDRILLKPNRGGRTAFPAKDDVGYGGAPEQSLALTIQGYYNAPQDSYNGFVHIEAEYPTEGKGDPRIPSVYNVKMYGDSQGTYHLLHEFPEIKNEYSAEDRDKMPSKALKTLFDQVHQELNKLDQQAIENAKTGNRKGIQTQWTPLSPEADESGLLHPPRGIPEQHVPRPHRSLDALVSMLEKLDDSSLDKILQELEPEEQEVVRAVVRGPRGAGYFFSEEQRDLAERHARYLDPTGKNQFLSDTRKEIVEKIPPVIPNQNDESSKQQAQQMTEQIQQIYLDSHNELKHGGGRARPEADHHVPRSTGAGTNYFSNLLWISHAQNLSKKAQNKPVGLTNPNRKGGKGFDLGDFADEKREPEWNLPQSQKLSTIAKGTSTTTKVKEKDWDTWQVPLEAPQAQPEELKAWAKTAHEELIKETIAAMKRTVVSRLNHTEFEEEVKKMGPEVMPWEIEKIAAKYQGNRKYTLT